MGFIIFEVRPVHLHTTAHCHSLMAQTAFECMSSEKEHLTSKTWLRLAPYTLQMVGVNYDKNGIELFLKILNSTFPGPALLIWPRQFNAPLPWHTPHYSARVLTEGTQQARSNQCFAAGVEQRAGTNFSKNRSAHLPTSLQRHGNMGHRLSSYIILVKCANTISDSAHSLAYSFILLRNLFSPCSSSFFLRNIC